ncbi:hypothetical protein SXAG_00164 [Synechococcus phage S-CBS4]|nr:hypothetical protein SXAG_00164 [Synechococcus phage S-CBS4]
MSNPELDNLVMNDEQPTISIELNVQEVNTILAALGELPHRVADPILRKVVEQAQKQVN